MSIDKYLDKPVASVTLDQGNAINYQSSEGYEDASADLERQGRIKSADYDKEELLSNALGITLDPNFSLALNLQSKKPLYALQNVAYWGTKDEKLEIQFEKAFEKNVKNLPIELKEEPLVCYNRDIEKIKSKENSFLRFIVILTNDEIPVNGKHIALLEKEIDSISYIFQSEVEINGRTETKFDIVKNKILTTDLVNNKYYKVYTMSNKSIVDWVDENGIAKKYLNSCCNDDIKGFIPISFKIDKQRKRVGLLLDTEEISAPKLDVVQLQKKIIAVQSLKPNVNQLKNDKNTPPWVARRLDFSEFGIASEDLTLENGESYYWEPAKCWVVKDYSSIVSEKSKTEDITDSSYYWEVGPFLKGGNKERTYNSESYNNDKYNNKYNESNDSSLNSEIGKFYKVKTTDVTKFNDNSKIYTVNISPSTIAKKAYAVIIDDPTFDNSEFSTSGMDGADYKGIYFQSTRNGNMDSREVIKEGDYPYKRVRLHISDYEDEKEKKFRCFINQEISTPNNGLLIEAKEKIFDAYFLIKENAIDNVEEKQYDIIESLKNGRRTADGKEGKEYYALKIKKWNDSYISDNDFDNNIELEKNIFTNELRALKNFEDILIKNKVIVEREITKEDIEKNEKYKGLTPGRYHVFTNDKNILTKQHKYEESFHVDNSEVKVIFSKPFTEDIAGNIYTPISDEQEYINPIKMMAKTKHFTYHEKNVFVKNGSGKLLQPEYLLSFGFNQEKITTFNEWELFKEKFAKFNKATIPENILKNNMRVIPWWKQEGEYVFLNKAFVETFFQEEKNKNKCFDLKPTVFDKEDKYGLKFEITEKEISDINKQLDSSMEGSDFLNKYVDCKVDEIFDNFYEMVCNVWGKEDSSGVPRTKAYFLKDTPFEIKEIKNDKGKEDSSGFDARELLDNIIARSFNDAYDKDINEYIFKRLQEFFKSNKNIILDEEENVRALFNEVNKGIQEAVQASSYREFGELSDDIKKQRDIAYNNALSRMYIDLYELKCENANEKVKNAIVSSKIYKSGFATTVAVLTTSAAIGIGTTAAIAGAAAGVLFVLAKIGIIASFFIIASPIALGIAAISIIAATTIAYKIIKSKNKKTDISPDYVYKFTCRAKRALRQYSITKRGPILPGIENVENKNGIDIVRRKSYYNWLGEKGQIIPKELLTKEGLNDNYDPYDGRVMVIIPTTDEIIENNDDKLNGSILQNVEEFIQSWMGKQSHNQKVAQSELPISGYYDMLSGMHPWIEIKLRTGLGTCGRKKWNNGYVFYNEDGKPFLYKDEKSFYIPDEKNGYDSDGDLIEENLRAIDSKTAAKLAQSSFITLDSTSYPYFTSMSIVDNGIKKVRLELFDPNFASYTEGIKVKTNESETIISLESLIRGALRSPVFFQDETIEKYAPSGDGKIQNDYLAIDESLVVSPTNLKIRFGYDDCDSIGKNEGAFGLSNGRFGRWWDTGKWGNTGEDLSLSKIKKWVDKNSEIKNKAGVWINTPFGKKINAADNNDSTNDNEPTVTINETSGVVMNESDSADIAFAKHIKSYEQTTEKSREMEFMITNMSSNLTPKGIRYTIEAIESKDATIMRTRFLQRYAEITANPEEALYILMHMFNEDNDGNNINGSKVKIILISDDNDMDVPMMRDKLNMEYEIKNIREEDLDGTEATNVYEKAYQDEELEIKEELLKKITLTLGGASATKNYGVSSESYRPLYKTLAQLLNEFCAACPPKKLIEKRQTIVDENGNNILSNQESTTARPLKWFSVEDSTNGITYVCLYYRTVIKAPRIRVYTWGPNNPTTSCVKSISIKNANEFGILSGIRAFDGEKNRCISRLNNTTLASGVSRNEISIEQSKFTSDGVYGNADYIGTNAEAYDNAYSSSMYEGSIEILGDPFWSFDGILQPCTYPIKLNVVMPKNDFTNYYESQKGTRQFEKIEELKNKFGTRATYQEGPGFAKRQYPYDGTEINTVETFEQKGNQSLHEMSGYYVIKTIEHTITPNDFTTKLGIMSYPNIQKDVLYSKKQWDVL